MIQTVNSAEIDTSGLARLFQEPENKSIERLAKLFKEEVKKAVKMTNNNVVFFIILNF